MAFRLIVRHNRNRFCRELRFCFGWPIFLKKLCSRLLFLVILWRALVGDIPFSGVARHFFDKKKAFCFLGKQSPYAFCYTILKAELGGLRRQLL